MWSGAIALIFHARAERLISCLHLGRHQAHQLLITKTRQGFAVDEEGRRFIRAQFLSVIDVLLYGVDHGLAVHVLRHLLHVEQA